MNSEVDRVRPAKLAAAYEKVRANERWGAWNWYCCVRASSSSPLPAIRARRASASAMARSVSPSSCAVAWRSSGRFARARMTSRLMLSGMSASGARSRGETGVCLQCCSIVSYGERSE